MPAYARLLVFLVPVCLGALAIVAMTLAGPLSPPAGPVTGTYKTLAEVEPRIAVNATNTPGDSGTLFKIVQPGSYYLTGNIQGVADKIGIGIAAAGVTLDLNGFEIVGGVGGQVDGVAVIASGLSNITVRNGSIRGWTGFGLNTASFETPNSRIERIFATSNAFIGIYASINSFVTDCGAYANGTAGILVTSAACTITNCSACNNGFDGIVVASACTVAGCTVRGNVGHGIRCASACIIRDNICDANGVSAVIGAGVRAIGSGNRIEGNHCTGADIGVSAVTAGNLIVRNSCSGNTTDWIIAANNICGPIIDRRAPGSAAVSGFAAASSLGSTDPNANYSY